MRGNMPEMTLTEAAKWAGKSRTALFKSIQKGRLSAKKTEDGQWLIDPAELARVYRPAASVYDTGEQQSNGGEISGLRQVITLLERQIEDVRNERDHWRAQAEAQTRLLNGQRRSWWQRLRGKG
jgi:hypothetical protein